MVFTIHPVPGTANSKWINEWSNECALALLHFTLVVFPINFTESRILYCKTMICSPFPPNLYQHALVFTYNESFFNIWNFKWVIFPLLQISVFALYPFISSITSTTMTRRISNNSSKLMYLKFSKITKCAFLPHKRLWGHRTRILHLEKQLSCKGVANWVYSATFP